MTNKFQSGLEGTYGKFTEVEVYNRETQPGPGGAVIMLVTRTDRQRNPLGLGRKLFLS